MRHYVRVRARENATCTTVKTTRTSSSSVFWHPLLNVCKNVYKNVRVHVYKMISITWMHVRESKSRQTFGMYKRVRGGFYRKNRSVIDVICNCEIGDDVDVSSSYCFPLITEYGNKNLWLNHDVGMNNVKGNK